MLELINMTTISIALMIIGAVGVVLLTKPLDKVIMVSVLGLFLAIATFKYLDVAFLTAMLDPLSIIVFLIALMKIYNVRKSKMEDYSTIDNLEIIKENDGELNERPFKEAR